MAVRRIFSFILSVFILLLFTSCGSGNLYFFSEKYQKNTVTGATLTVIPDITQFLSMEDHNSWRENKINNLRPLSELEKGLIKNYLHLIFQENTYLTLVNIPEKSNEISIGFEKKDVLSDKEKGFYNYLPVNLHLPGNQSSDYLFIVEDVFFRVQNEFVGGGLGKAPTNLFYLRGGLQYLLYNCKSKEVISFGLAEEKITSYEVPKKDDYLNLISLMVKKVVSNTPFKKRVVLF